MIYRLTLIISFFLLSWSLSAQQEERIDHIYLHGGNFIQGMIIDTVDQSYLQLHIGGDSLLTIPLSLIEKVNAGNKSIIRNRKGRSAQSGGFFFEIAGQVLSAKSYLSYSDELRTNISLQFNGGYFVRPWISVGAGLSFDRYAHVIAPIFGQIRLYVPERATTPYLGLQAGWGVDLQKVFDRQEYDVSRGGWMWHPSIGLRMASRSDVDFHFDMGYRFQQITDEFDYPQDWWTTNVREQLTYRSFVLRLACTF